MSEGNQPQEVPTQANVLDQAQQLVQEAEQPLPVAAAPQGGPGGQGNRSRFLSLVRRRLLRTRSPR